MTHADLERDLATWLHADAAAVTVPHGLRQRVLDIPMAPAEHRGWVSRFWPLLAAPVAATTAIAGVLVVVLFFGLFDAPAGADGEPCNRRQTQRALDELRGSDGYRYVIRFQQTDLDRSRPVSLGDPEWAWIDMTVTEGAYLAPDHFVDRTLNVSHGPQERRQTGDGHWELWDLDGELTWIEQPRWPTANVAWGNIQNAMPTAMIPAVSTLGFGGTEADLEDELPGAGGCIAIAEIPEERPPSVDGVEVIIPEGMIPTRYLALRVDVATGQPTSILIGPAGSITRQGLSRTTIEVTWDVPDADEIQPPGSSIPDPFVSATPPPVPTPVAFGDGAWSPTLLEDANGTVTINSMQVAGSRIVALGSRRGTGDTWRSEAWVSDDGEAWTTVTPEAWESLSMGTLAWNGSELLAIGVRSEPDGSASAVEVWRSPDGLTWELLGQLDGGAWPGRLIAAGPGWVLTGWMATSEIQQRPALWTSADGRRWEEASLEGTASGMLGPVVRADTGELIATGCESPDDPDGPQSGSGACFARLWRSSDGTIWEAGPVLDFEVADLDMIDGGLLAVGAFPRGQLVTDPYEDEHFGTLFASPDGEIWAEIVGFPQGVASPHRLHLVGDDLVVTGARMNFTSSGGYSIAYAWRSADGERWEPIELGLPADAIGSEIVGVYETDAGIAFVGHVMLSETEFTPATWTEP